MPTELPRRRFSPGGRRSIYGRACAFTTSYSAPCGTASRAPFERASRLGTSSRPRSSRASFPKASRRGPGLPPKPSSPATTSRRTRAPSTWAAAPARYLVPLLERHAGFARRSSICRLPRRSRGGAWPRADFWIASRSSKATHSSIHCRTDTTCCFSLGHSPLRSGEVHPGPAASARSRTARSRDAHRGSVDGRDAHEAALGALLAANYILFSSEGDTYSVDEVRPWLSRAGWRVAHEGPSRPRRSDERRHRRGG
jgi:hypothetical protein